MKSKNDEKVIQWPDFFASDYISTPKELENISAYEFVMWYEKENWIHKDQYN